MRFDNIILKMHAEINISFFSSVCWLFIRIKIDVDYFLVNSSHNIPVPNNIIAIEVIFKDNAVIYMRSLSAL